MRHIKKFEARIDAELDAAWKQRAQNAQTAIAALPNGDKPDKDRSDAINARSQIWADAKPALRKLSHQKCWYCECLEVRSDGAVDHHRPKNEVKEYGTDKILDHPGYWWLAFDPTNFRYSCQWCNEIRKDATPEEKGGKSSYFPIHDENNRVKEPSGDLDLEDPTLLDPTKAADPPLLTFDANGKILPRHAQSSNPRFYERADVSIKVYHLYHSRLEAERKKVADAVSLKVKEGEKQRRRYFNDLCDMSAKDAWESAMGDLYELISEESAFSMQAICVLRKYRGYEWVDDLLAA